MAYVCAATGWDWDRVIESLTIPRLQALTRHWRQAPPVAVQLAAFFGIGAGSQSSDGSDDDGAALEDLKGLL